ncbi:branched-chain amino acid ABC transporter permease [Acidisoma cellulosilytica]|uniref:Branched-chain amino acid ABC transporter permease n=1 Tax=Acidisoma cellulosilyticum TaxID=2802395 RepID=A0A963Z6E2_9PROT|nr:branched-chain amino acid ABC transporter permease [Acidisoma cellulosilyticum]MCB8883714.1 branched-chain amino acid ABC transporter permease [Acidisoma cellulosilyticum]
MLDTVVTVLTTGLTNGALYALATIGLSLVWGSMGMFNMAHGAMLALGGYLTFTVCTQLGLPLPVAVIAAVAGGALFGVLLYLVVVQRLLARSTEHFETSVMIATAGISIALEEALLVAFGGQPLKQPFTVSGNLHLGQSVVPLLDLADVVIALIVMGLTYWFLSGTKMGRAIRATAQNRDAAVLMGVPVQRIFLQALAISGALAGICGVLMSSVTQLTPWFGDDPMLKAFIMCVVAGLGNLPGAIAASFCLAIIEAAVEFLAGARWGFPALLFIVIAILIWRPAGLFGRSQIRRL